MMKAAVLLMVISGGIMATILTVIVVLTCLLRKIGAYGSLSKKLKSKLGRP